MAKMDISYIQKNVKRDQNPLSMHLRGEIIMETYDWLTELYKKAAKDDWYQACLRDVKRLERTYAQITDHLSEKECDALSDYISATEELGHSLMFLAYELGVCHGRYKCLAAQLNGGKSPERKNPPSFQPHMSLPGGPKARRGNDMVFDG